MTEDRINIKDTPALARAYLINVAETINSILIPGLEGQARDRAFDCLRTLSRVAAQMKPAIPHEPSEDTIEAAWREGAAYKNFNLEAAALLQQFTAAQAGLSRAFDFAALERFLRAHPLGGPDLRIVEAKMLAGGRSKVTVAVAQEGALNLPRDLIIRQDWSESAVGRSVIAEYELLQALHDRGIKVPRPLLMSTEKAQGITPYIVVTRSSGKPYGDSPRVLPPSEQPLLELAAEIGRVHALDTDAFAGFAGITERDNTPEQLRASLAVYRSTIARLGYPHSHLIGAVLGWLEKNVERAAGGPKSIVHGDLGVHNSLYENGELRVILDWELSHIGSPAYDLGYLRNAVTDDAMWARFMAAYSAAGGPHVAPFLVDFYHLFVGVWFYQLFLQSKAALSTGVLHDITIVAATADILPPAMEGLARSFKRAVETYGFG